MTLTHQVADCFAWVICQQECTLRLQVTKRIIQWQVRIVSTMGDDDVRWARHLWSCFIYRGQSHSQPSCLVMFCHVFLTFKILRCKAALPLASRAISINVYFQGHKENTFAYIRISDITCSIASYFFTVSWHLPEHRQWSAGEEAEASRGMGSLHDSIELFSARAVLFSSYLFMFDWCLVCFQICFIMLPNICFLHFPINRCYLKEGCEHEVASSCT